MSFSTLLDTPFYTGSGGLSDQVPFPWPIAIDGHPFVVDLTHYAWDIPDMMRVSFDSSDRPGEGTFETKGVWRRVYQDWSLGAGQIYADPATSDKQATRQFTSSIGIDCWTPRQFSLLPDTEALVSGGDASPTLCFALGPHLYLVLGSLFFRMSNPMSDTPASQVIESISQINDITTDGNTVFIASVSGIWTHDSTAATLGADLMPAPAGTYDADTIEFANGFLLAAKGPELASFAVDGTKTVVDNGTRINGWTWTAIVGAPNAIYAGGGAVDRSCIYSISLDPDTGGLGSAVYAGELPRGEALTSLTYYGTIIMVGTTKGWHVAEIGGSNQLSIGPLIPTPLPVMAMTADANFVWYAWSDYDGTHTGIGRANLGEFTDTLLPAYASDLMAGTSGTVSAIARYQDHTFFGVDGVGVFREVSDGSLVPTAQIRLGRLEWGTAAAKTFLGVEIVSEPLDGSFTAVLEDETLTDVPIGGRAGQDSTGRDVLLGSGLGTNSNFYDLILNLARGTDPTTGPVMRTITGRALPLPRETQTWTLPIIAKSIVQPAGDAAGIDKPQDVKEIWDFLIALRESGRPVIYQTGKDRQLVIVRSVTLPDGGADQFTADRSAVQGILLVTLASAED